jgi:hypothetical protein
MLSPGRERHGAGNYALPVLLKQDGASILPLLAALVEGRGVVEAGDVDVVSKVGGAGAMNGGGGGEAWSERRSAALVGRCRLTR